MTDYKICLVCAISFLPKQNTKGMFCSRLCHQKWQVGENNPFFGKKHSVETLEKQSLAKKGKPSKSKGVPRPQISGENNPSKRLDIKAKISKAKRGMPLPKLKGSNCHFWRGGVTSENQNIRRSALLREWRRQVFERDNYTCVFCGKRGGVIHADHIKQFAYYPELRTKLSNGRTLCRECHRKTETYSKKQ